MTSIDNQRNSNKILKQLEYQLKNNRINDKLADIHKSNNSKNVSNLDKEQSYTSSSKNEKNKNEEIFDIDLIKGTHKVFTSLKFTKNDLFFRSKPNEISFDSVIITNTGTTCIYFKWQKNNKSNKLIEKKGDGIDKFFCHYSDSKLSPNESKEFVFSFFAERNGTFYEDWILLTSPHVKNVNLNLHLNGLCCKIIDEYSEKVSYFDIQIEKNAIHTMIKEMVLDMIGNIKHTEPPLPKMNEENDFKYYFPKLNKPYNVEYSQYAMKLFNSFISKLNDYLTDEDKNILIWEGSISEIKSKILLLADKSLKETLNFQLECIIHLSREKNCEDSYLFTELFKLIEELALELGDEINQIREELIFYPIVFSYLTMKNLDNKEQEKFNQDQKKKIDEFYKKNKKKVFKNKEEEETDIKNMKDKVHQKVEMLLISKINSLIEIDKRNKIDQIVENSNIFTDYYINDFLSKIDTIKNTKNIEGQIVLLRIDIQEKDVEYEENSVNDIKNISGIKDMSGSIIETQNKENQVYVIKKIIGSEKIFKSLETLINLRAKLVLLLIDFGPKSGTYNSKFSSLLIKDYLIKEGTFDQTAIEFESNFEGLVFLNERLNEESPDVNKYQNLKENSILILENINFEMEECGYELFEIIKNPIGFANESQIHDSNNSNESNEKSFINNEGKDNNKSKSNKSKEDINKSKIKETNNSNLMSQSKIIDRSLYCEKINLTYYTKMRFLNQFSKNINFYINDSINSFFNKYPTIIDMNNTKRIIGTRIEDQFSKIVSFFTINSKNLLLIIGSEHNNSNENDLLNKLLTINSIMNRFKCIVILGKIGLMFLTLIQSEFCFDKNITFPNSYINLMKFIIVKAKLNNIEIILPEDLRVIPKKENDRFYGYDQSFYDKVMDSLILNETGELPLGPNDVQIKNFLFEKKINLQEVISKELLKRENIHNEETIINEEVKGGNIPKDHIKNMKSSVQISQLGNQIEEPKLNTVFNDGVDYINYYMEYIRILEKREKKAKLIVDAATGEEELDENEDYKYFKLTEEDEERLKIYDPLNENNIIILNLQDRLESFYNLQNIKLPRKMLKNEKEENEFYKSLYNNKTILPSYQIDNIDNINLTTNSIITNENITKEKERKKSTNNFKSSNRQVSILSKNDLIRAKTEKLKDKDELNISNRKTIIPLGYEYVDFGPRTYQKLENKIKEANCIMWIGEITPKEISNLYFNYDSIINAITNRRNICKKEADEVLNEEGKKLDTLKAKKFLLNVILKSNKTYETFKKVKKKQLFTSDQEEGGDDGDYEDALIFEMLTLIDFLLDDKLEIIDKLLEGLNIPGLYGLTISETIQYEEEEMDLKFLDEI